MIATGREDEAAGLLEDALEVFERHFGGADYEVGAALGGLGAIDARRGNVARAEDRLPAR